MVSRSSPTATASVLSPTGPPPKRRHKRIEHGAVEPVEPGLVDLEQLERPLGQRDVDRAVAADLGEVADPPQQSVGDPRGAPRPRRDLGGRVGIDRDLEQSGRSGHDPLQVVGLVELEMAGEAEPVAQRTRAAGLPGSSLRPG